jgi:outer membrane protein assembly factor BamB
MLAQACGFSQSAEVVNPGTEPTLTGTDDWPQFRGNALLTGVSETALKEPLELAWIYEAGESIESSAAIVDGVVYVGSQSGELLALELETGELRWKYQATEAIGESSPAVSDGVVYVGDLAGVLHAVEVKSGAGLWTFESEAEIRSSPVVVDGKVLFGSYDGHLYAVSARTGKLLWKRVTEGPVHSTASVAQGMAHIAGCDGYFRAIRVADGKEVFQVLAGAYTGASPPLVSGRTYFGTFDNEVLGVDLSRQQVIWRYEHPTRHFPYNSSAAVTGGKVIVGGRDKMVHALDARTGEEIWNFRTRGTSGPARGSTLRRLWSAAESTLAPMTAGYMCWTQPMAEKCGSLKRGRRSQPLRLSRADDW